MARQYAGTAGRIMSLPETNGTAKAKMSQAAGIRAGTRFRIRPYPAASFLLNCICLKRVIPSSISREVTLDFKVDVTAFSESSYEPPTYAPTPQDEFDADPITIQDMIELPRPISGSQIAIAALLVRPHALIIAYELHRSSNDVTYSSLNVGKSFATSGTLDANVSATDTTMTLNMAAADILSISGQSSEDADNNTVLIFLDGEIMSLEGYTVLGGNQVQLTSTRRGRYDTVGKAHSSGTRAFIILREKLVLNTHETFTEAATRYLKPTTATALAQQDISTSTADSLIIGARYLQPVMHSDFTVEGSGTAPTYSTGSDIDVAWTIRTWTDVGFPSEDFYNVSQVETVIEILDSGDVLKRTINKASGSTSHTYTNAELLADFITEPATFKVRIKAKYNGRESYQTCILTVTLV